MVAGLQLGDEPRGSGCSARPHLRRRAYSAAAKLDGVDPAGEIHYNSRLWRLLGPGDRTVPDGALVHAGVEERLKVDPAYAAHLPTNFT